MLQIIETQPQKQGFELFETLPALLYAPESPRFRLPDSLPTAWLVDCYVLLENDSPVARASLYENPYLQWQGRQVFCIGAYEAINNTHYAQFLGKHLETVVQGRGGGVLVGTMNGSTWENYRLSLHHDSPPFFLESYHHLYYNAHFEAMGFQVIARYFSSIDREIKHNFPEVLQLEKHFEAMGVTLRCIDMGNYEAELKRVHQFNLLAYQTNFLYSPIEEADFLHKYASLKTLLHPELVIFAEDAQQNLIGYFFSVEDFWNKETKTLIVKSIARHPDAQWRGLGHVIGNQLCRNALKLGYTQMLHAFLRENGTSTGISRNYAGEIFKQYALYGKTIE